MNVQEVNPKDSWSSRLSGWDRGVDVKTMGPWFSGGDLITTKKNMEVYPKTLYDTQKFINN